MSRRERSQRTRLESGCSRPMNFSKVAKAPERPRPCKVALVPKQDGEVVEAPGYLGMLGAERLLPDSQGALQERPHRRHVAKVSEQDG
jgi:hypothetical protein